MVRFCVKLRGKPSVVLSLHLFVLIKYSNCKWPSAAVVINVNSQ